MSWSKLKTIIILILLILNLFLFSLVAFLQVQSARYEASALSQALEVLTQSGISIDASALPESMDLPTLSVARDTVREQEVAEQLAGSRSDQLVSFLNNGRFYATLDPPVRSRRGAAAPSRPRSCCSLWESRSGRSRKRPTAPFPPCRA